MVVLRSVISHVQGVNSRGMLLLHVALFRMPKTMFRVMLKLCSCCIWPHSCTYKPPAWLRSGNRARSSTNSQPPVPIRFLHLLSPHHHTNTPPPPPPSPHHPVPPPITPSHHPPTLSHPTPTRGARSYSPITSTLGPGPPPS